MPSEVAMLFEKKLHLSSVGEALRNKFLLVMSKYLEHGRTEGVVEGRTYDYLEKHLNELVILMEAIGLSNEEKVIVITNMPSLLNTSSDMITKYLLLGVLENEDNTFRKNKLINRLAGKKVATIGNNPGVTKSLSWLKTSSNILLLDSPGILWPKLADEEGALNLASLSAIPRDILPVDKVAIHILNKLGKYYPQVLKERYNLDSMDNDDIVEVYETIGRRIGAVISGGEIDYDRVSKTILEDIKNERIKNITFDRIDD